MKQEKMRHSAWGGSKGGVGGREGGRKERREGRTEGNDCLICTGRNNLKLQRKHSLSYVLVDCCQIDTK